MPINKIKGLSGRHDDRHDDGLDFTDPRTFLNSIFNQQGGIHAPSPSHFPPTHGHSHGSHGGPAGGSGGSSLIFRSIDGSGNNLNDPTINAAGTNMVRMTPAHFAGDDGHTPIDNGINPRDVSNIVVGQGETGEANSAGLSGMIYAWGQFIDHDLDMIKSGTDPINVTIPVSAEDPQGGKIDVFRSAIAPGTGTGADNPAAAINKISGWLDGSQVYGSDAATAASMRLADGHMKTSAGDNLPIVQMPNPDPNNPGMIDAFLAGDVRAQENPSLTALQTLFVREHNFQVDLAHQQHPNWTGDQLYQYARAVVTAEMEHITYDEFLPHLLGAGAIQPYHGYDPTVNPTITEEFAGAAYRWGHSTVSAETNKILENGQTSGPEQELKDVFFEAPSAFMADGGADGVLRHLGADLSQEMDARIVNDLRNFLADPPDLMDLAAINIQRGHDLGLGTLNETRVALGLTAYTSFDQITDDAETAAAMDIAFKHDVNLVDLWTGGLAEKHMPGAFIGETFGKIVGAQFEALRDGDRLWYENQGFDAKTLATIKDTSLSDIIMRNTDTQHMQDDAFVYYSRHGGLKGGGEAEHPDSPQLVIGSKGFDTLVGGPQGDMLVAAKGGVQTMTGNEGGDRFIFGAGMKGVITDFKPGEDKIVLEDAPHLGFRDLSIKSDHGNTVVEGNGSHIVLMGVNPYQLHAHDFVYQS